MCTVCKLKINHVAVLCQEPSTWELVCWESIRLLSHVTSMTGIQNEITFHKAGRAKSGLYIKNAWHLLLCISTTTIILILTCHYISNHKVCLRTYHSSHCRKCSARSWASCVTLTAWWDILSVHNHTFKLSMFEKLLSHQRQHTVLQGLWVLFFHVRYSKVAPSGSNYKTRDFQWMTLQFINVNHIRYCNINKISFDIAVIHS